MNFRERRRKGHGINFQTGEWKWLLFPCLQRTGGARGTMSANFSAKVIQLLEKLTMGHWNHSERVRNLKANMLI